LNHCRQYKRKIKPNAAFFEFDHFEAPGKKQKKLISSVLENFENFFDLKVSSSGI
jgi:hypothetical protein